MVLKLIYRDPNVSRVLISAEYSQNPTTNKLAGRQDVGKEFCQMIQRKSEEQFIAQLKEQQFNEEKLAVGLTFVILK